MKLKRAVSIALCCALVCQPLCAAAAQDPIEGVEGLYYSYDNGFKGIYDEAGNRLAYGNEIEVISAEDRVFEVYVPMAGMGRSDGFASVVRIDENNVVHQLVEPSISQKRVSYSNLNGAKFVSERPMDKGSLLFDGTHRDLDGNIIEDIEAYLAPYGASLEIDDWAKDTVSYVYEYGGWLPNWMACNFKNKITRSDFCILVIEMIKQKKNNDDLKDSDRKQLPVIEDSYTSPFTDVDNYYVSAAYNLGIVSGRGDGRFAPYEYITRQEAAVMLVNAAKVMGIDDYDSTKSVGFVDESYFADWAEDAIDRICRIKNENGEYIMTGTGQGKFSPWWNYSREQAIVTLDRLYYTQTSIDNEFRVPVRADYKAIGESYSLGGFENSLFTKASLDSYFEKWSTLAQTQEEQDYVESLSNICNITARYLAALDVLNSENAADTDFLQSSAESMLERFQYGLYNIHFVDRLLTENSHDPYALLFFGEDELSGRIIEIWKDLYNENKINLTQLEKKSNFSFADLLEQD